MDINIREQSNLINSYFVLNNFCKERKESLNQKHIDIPLNDDKETVAIKQQRNWRKNNQTNLPKIF